MKIFVKNRRGLSNVVTSALLLTFVAVLGTSMVAWSQTNLRSFETNLSNSTGANTNQINENLLIENVGFFNQVDTYINSPPQGMNVTITNIGLEGVTITNVQVNGTDDSQKSFFTITGNSPGPWLTTNPLRLLPHQSGTLIVESSWHSKSQSTFNVVTSRGSIITTQAVAR